MLASWEARERYDAALENPSSTAQEIGRAGADLVCALQRDGREVPDLLLNDILDQMAECCARQTPSGVPTTLGPV